MKSYPEEDLFTIAHSRRNDPQTSFDAPSKETAGRQCEIVLATLNQHPHGLTPYEVSDRCSLTYSQSERRMSDLKNKGIAEVVLEDDGSPLTRKNRWSNRPSQVVRAVK